MWNNKKISPLRIIYPPCIILFLVLIIPYLRLYFTALGLRWLYILLFSFTLSFILTPVFGWIARRFSILDIPDDRKIHAKNTPLLGGAAIMISFCASLTANMILEMETIALLLGGLIVGVIGLLDDWKGMSAKLKLIIQICVVLMLIYNGIILDLFPIKTTWGYIANSVLTVVWIVGITNAMNFFDGMDGLATGLSTIIALFIGIVSFQTNQPFMGWIAIAIVGSCLGFLPFNFRPKKPAAIFLGDAGSTFLGFILAGLAIKGYWADNRPIVSFATPILIFWILIFDMTYITVERIITGKVKTVKEWIDYVLTIFLLSATLGLSSIALRNARMIDAIILVCQAFLIAIIVSVIEYAGRNKG